MTLPDFLTQDADGYVHVTGHRIGLQDLVYFYYEGDSPEALLEALPTLSLALIHKVIAFYLEQTADVDAYVAACEQEVERQRAAAPQGPGRGRTEASGCDHVGSGCTVLRPAIILIAGAKTRIA